MYKLSKQLPISIIYIEKGNSLLGSILLLVGIVGEFFSMYFIFTVIDSTSFFESSVILNMLTTSTLPISFFITSFGGFCLILACKELFYSSGWELTNEHKEKLNSVEFVILHKFLSFTWKTTVKLENMKGFVIQRIYYDELKITSRKRLILLYNDSFTNIEKKHLLIKEKYEALQSQIMQIIKEFEIISKKEFRIEIIDSNNSNQNIMK